MDTWPTLDEFYERNMAPWLPGVSLKLANGEAITEQEQRLVELYNVKVSSSTEVAG